MIGGFNWKWTATDLLKDQKMLGQVHAEFVVDSLTRERCQSPLNGQGRNRAVKTRNLLVDLAGPIHGGM